MSGRGLHPDGVAGDELTPDQHGPEDHLEAVEEVVPDDDDGAAPGGPALARGDGLDAGDGRGGVEAGVQGCGDSFYYKTWRHKGQALEFNEN